MLDVAEVDVGRGEEERGDRHRYGKRDEAREIYRRGIEVSTQTGDMHTLSELEAVLELLG